MKTKPEYSQFIFDLNNGIILEFAFEVEGYAHYSECRIYLTHEISKLGNSSSNDFLISPNVLK